LSIANVTFMKLAVTDAYIFIDLYDLQLTDHFFQLGIEIHTSVDVLNELYTHQQQMLAAFQSAGKLIAHIIKEEDKKEIQANLYPKSLSDSDKTVLYLAARLEAMVLSSDKMVRNSAKNNAIDYYGMIWIFDKLVESNLISKLEASIKLKQLISTKIGCQSNKELVKALDARVAIWCKV
jgi:predicted nucleic acid-binding protein